MINNRRPGPPRRQGWLDNLAAAPNKLAALAVICCASAGAIAVLVPAPRRYTGLATVATALAVALRWLAVWTAIGDTTASTAGDWQISLNEDGFREIRHLPSVAIGSSAEPFATYWRYRQARRAVISGRPAASLQASRLAAGFEATRPGSGPAAAVGR